MATPSISVVVITLDEEANIARCLESVRWADEIVVVDSGSTDRTVEICEAHNCRIIAQEWEGYPKQKNCGIRQASGDWILSLDADEEISGELGAEIREAVGSDRADAYSMPRRNQFLGRWMRRGGWYPDRQLRLFRRGCAEFKMVPLHEYLELRDENVRVAELVNPLLHYTYPTVSDFIEKANRYTSIEAVAMVKEGRLPKSLMFSLVLAMPAKFLEVYLYKWGWRDGLHGFIAAILMSVRVFMRYLKVWQALRRETREDS